MKRIVFLRVVLLAISIQLLRSAEAHMTQQLDVFLVSTLLVFLSLIEVLVTTILDNNDQVARAKKLDRYCRVIVPVIFVIASIAIFAHPGG